METSDEITAVTPDEAETELERSAIQSEGHAQLDTQNSWPILSQNALQGIAGEIVQLIEPHTEADRAALLLQFLCAFGSLAGRRAFFRVEADRHYPNLYMVLVGPTASGRKGTSLRRVLSIFESVDPAWRKDRIQSGLSTGEGLINAVRDPVTKGGGESLQIVDEGVTDKRLLAVESEFASILRVAGRDGNTLSPVIRNAWDGDQLQTLTKNSPLKATDSHISIIGHITTEELLRYLNSTETANGFANRFLWVSSRRSKELPEGGGTVDFHDIIPRLRRAVENPTVLLPDPCGVQFDPSAKEIWYAVYGRLSAGQSGLLGSITSRAAPQVLRLSLIYALLDCAGKISASHLNAALSVWNYAEDSARFIFGETLGDRLADIILKALRNTPFLTRTSISALFNRNQNTARINAALSLLQKEGKAKCELTNVDGKTTQIWFAVLGNKSPTNHRSFR